MRKPWLLVGGIVLSVVGVAGLVLPLIPGIAFLILGWIMIRSSMTGEPVTLPRVLRRNRAPVPDPLDS